jgi:hypothetical protein
MAVHGSQGILNGQRQPKPRHEYAVPRYRITLVRDNLAAPSSSSLTTSVAAAAVRRPLFAGLDRDQFLVCGLDAKHGIIGVNIVSIGSLTLAIIHPREVFKPLILMNAAAWICAHNLCGAPHKLCYVTLRVMWSPPGTREKHVEMREAGRPRPSRTSHNYSCESQARIPGSFCHEDRGVGDRGSHCSVE